MASGEFAAYGILLVPSDSNITNPADFSNSASAFSPFPSCFLFKVSASRRP